MTSRSELYEKFGITAEAAQLFETALGSILLGSKGIMEGWFAKENRSPDNKIETAFNERIERSTLGRLLKDVSGILILDDQIVEQFDSALSVRNDLFHHFYRRHNFSIQTSEGRTEMLDDLEKMHDELFHAWQLADAIGGTLTQHLLRLRTSDDIEKHGPIEKIEIMISDVRQSKTGTPL